VSFWLNIGRYYLMLEGLNLVPFESDPNGTLTPMALT